MRMNKFDYNEAFCRNIPLISKGEQLKLKKAVVAVPGMGGMGGSIFLCLARMGFENFHISDMDSFDVVNNNRQVGCMRSTDGKKKVDVMRDIILDINPNCKVKVFAKGISEENIDEFLEGVDVVMDGMDYFNFDIRRLIHMRAYEKGIYVVGAGPIAFGSAFLVFSPDGMSFDKYFDIKDDMSYKEKIIAFSVGLVPSLLQTKYVEVRKFDLKNKSGPSSSIAVNLGTGIACFEAMNIILRRRKIYAAPYYGQFDVQLMQLKRGRVFLGNRNPIQRIKRWFIGKYLF
ncbi:MAG: ThiF family adenylyltransferase [archaeon]